jgi:hypothetical protein
VIFFTRAWNRQWTPPSIPWRRKRKPAWHRQAIRPAGSTAYTLRARAGRCRSHGTAVRLARQCFRGSTVRYAVADLLDYPQEWLRAYDLVIEIITV